LAALSDAALIADVIALVFELLPGDRPVIDQLVDFLRERHTLLVLDNCEHLIEVSLRLQSGCLARAINVAR
jgi:predicted ATPase